MPRMTRIERARKTFYDLFPEKRDRVVLFSCLLVSLIFWALCARNGSSGHRWWAALFGVATYVPLWLLYKYTKSKPSTHE